MSEYPNRRLLIDVDSGTQQLVTVQKSVGAVSQEGDAWSSANMNAMEDRIYNAFEDAKNDTNSAKTNAIKESKQYTDGYVNQLDSAITSVMSNVISNENENQQAHMSIASLIAKSFTWWEIQAERRILDRGTIVFPRISKVENMIPTTIAICGKITYGENAYINFTKLFPVIAIYDISQNKYKTWEEDFFVPSSTSTQAFVKISALNTQLSVYCKDGNYILSDCQMYIMGNGI